VRMPSELPSMHAAFVGGGAGGAAPSSVPWRGLADLLGLGLEPWASTGDEEEELEAMAAGAGVLDRSAAGWPVTDRLAALEANGSDWKMKMKMRKVHRDGGAEDEGGHAPVLGASGSSG